MDISYKIEEDKKPYQFILNDVCRTCLTEASDMSDVFASGEKLLHFLRTFCDVKICKDDGLPTRMCRPCIEQATNANDFKHRCKLADTKLRNIFSNDHSVTSILDIKKELNLTNVPGFTNSKKQNIALECSICKDSYESLDVLIEHVIQNHTNTKVGVKIHSCAICQRQYSSEFDLKKHQVSHRNFVHNNRYNVCTLCKEEFHKRDVLLRHMGYHTEHSYYNCAKCDCFFTSNMHLKRHIQRIHQMSDSESNKDDDASSDFDNFDILAIKIEPEQTLLIESEDNDSLIKSERKFTDTEDLLTEITDSHLPIEYMKESSQDDYDILEGRDDDNDFDNFTLDNKSPQSLKTIKKNKKLKDVKRKCKNKTIRIVENNSRKEILNEMPKKKQNEKSFLCSICGKGFFKQMHLDKHIENHKKEPTKKPFHVCPVCGKTVHYSNHLLVHMRTHKDKDGQPLVPQTSNKRSTLLCSICGKSCTSRSNLSVHMRRHLGVMTCICKICGKGYPRTTDLTLHMRQHTGERPFVCSYCNKGFARSDKLAIHVRIHTGEKPYTCQICDRSFAQSNDLASHKKRHNCGTNLNSSNNTQTSSPTIAVSTNENKTVTNQKTPDVISIYPKNVYIPTNNANKVKKVVQSPQQKFFRILPAVEEKNPSEPSTHTKAKIELATAATNNLLLVSTNPANNPLIEINAKSMASKSMSDMMRQNLVSSNTLTTQRASGLANANYNMLTTQRVEFSEYTTAALLQNISNVQQSTSHFDLT